MRNYIKTRDGFVGFGETEQDALDDLYLQQCSQDISKDTAGKYKSRREELKPWLPLDTMLHINNVGCLQSHRNKIVEVSTGKEVVVNEYGGSIFYYLVSLFEDKLSYSDIMVSAKPEIEKFFSNISTSFFPLKTYPIVQLLNESNGFEPKTIYFTKNGIVIGVTDTMVGIKFIDDRFYVTTEYMNMFTLKAMLFRIALKAGIVIGEEGIVRDGYKNNGLG